MTRKLPQFLDAQQRLVGERSVDASHHSFVDFKCKLLYYTVTRDRSIYVCDMQ